MEIQSARATPAAQTGNRFDRTLFRHGLGTLQRAPTTTLQINVGKLCNQACKHCHVEAGPKRTEIMEAAVIERLIELAGDSQVRTVDLTGGAPEMNPHFRRLVEGMAEQGKEVIVRCNLTILIEPGYGWLVNFYVAQRVHLICSMPCYTPENVNQQRGKGVFDRSIAALQQLNAAGYGDERAPEDGGSGLVLDLVYNPLGAFLPGDQAQLEADYKRELAKHFGVRFNRLYTLANLPIGRFARSLERQGQLEPYLQRLEAGFNPATVPQLMCRTTLNVGWDGQLYDCDFNQMLDLPLGGGAPTLWDPDFALNRLLEQPIRTDAHCLGCTAGAGSSCGGALT